MKIDKNNGSHVKTSIFTCETHAVYICDMYNLHVKDIKSIERENRLLGLKHVVDNK